MNLYDDFYLKLSLAVAEKSTDNELKVGAVLVSQNEKIVCTAWNDTHIGLSWSDMLIAQAKAKKVVNAVALYLTINTFSKELNAFGLQEILNLINVANTYIGLPDPMVCNYLECDPVLNMDNITRYPDELQREILKQNLIYYMDSTQAISNSPYYHDIRISDLIIDKLTQLGVSLTKEELNAHKNKTALKLYISEQFGINLTQANTLVNEAIFESFNKKYGTYEYTNDTRSLDTEWRKNFTAVLNMAEEYDISKRAVIDVGVGGGHEASIIFSNYTNITFVDIAIDGLRKVQQNIPSAHIVNASADDLIVLEDKHYDVYVSLRTYNSSFFDIKRAIAEAKRILKENALIIISVANGFLCPEKHCIIPGLLIPRTDFVDLYRGLDTTRYIKNEYVHAGFKDIFLCPTSTEIFLSAKVA